MIYIKKDALEVIDEKSKEKSVKEFHDLKEVAEGESFIVVLFNNGKIEVYDKRLNFICSQVVPEAQSIIANSRIVVKLKDGIIRFYDKKLRLQFTRYAA